MTHPRHKFEQAATLSISLLLFSIIPQFLFI